MTVMLSRADVVVINKIDLLPHLDFCIEAFERPVMGLNHRARIVSVSCKTREGLKSWVSWPESQMKEQKGK